MPSSTQAVVYSSLIGRYREGTQSLLASGRDYGDERYMKILTDLLVCGFSALCAEKPHSIEKEHTAAPERRRGAAEGSVHRLRKSYCYHSALIPLPMLGLLHAVMHL